MPTALFFAPSTVFLRPVALQRPLSHRRGERLLCAPIRPRGPSRAAKPQPLTSLPALRITSQLLSARDESRRPHPVTAPRCQGFAVSEIAAFPPSATRDLPCFLETHSTSSSSVAAVLLACRGCTLGLAPAARDYPSHPTPQSAFAIPTVIYTPVLVSNRPSQQHEWRRRLPVILRARAQNRQRLLFLRPRPPRSTRKMEALHCRLPGTCQVVTRPQQTAIRPPNRRNLR